jgi:hypothetical protein
VIGEINWLTGRQPLEEPSFRIHYHDFTGTLTEITSSTNANRSTSESTPSSTTPTNNTNSSTLLVLPSRSPQADKESYYSLPVKCLLTTTPSIGSSHLAASPSSLSPTMPTEYLLWVGHLTSVEQVKHLIAKRGGPPERLTLHLHISPFCVPIFSSFSFRIIYLTAKVDGFWQ